MFTKIRANNYKSLVDFDVDLTKKSNETKPLIIVYGENGVGKSNFSNLFLTLCESLNTFRSRMQITRFMTDHFDEYDKMMSDEKLKNFLKTNFKDTESIIETSKTIDSTENMVLDFEFVVNNNRGRYLIEYDDVELVHERLEYVLNKNKVVFYDFEEDNNFINKKIFIDENYFSDFTELFYKYKGKHSFLSTLEFDIEDKARGYVKERITPKLYSLLKTFKMMSVRVKSGAHMDMGSVGVKYEMLTDLREGTISKNKENEILKIQKMLNYLFTTTYEDIKSVYYKTNEMEEKIHYKLFVRKKLYGKLVDIDFQQESTGTQKLLEILPPLLMCMEGETVIIDEIDSGIHDLLILKLLLSLEKSINGQMIITTHSTMLLDSGINPEGIYVFNIEDDGKKTLLPISHFENRLHPNLNYRNRYLKGIYGGIPKIDEFDFKKVKSILDES